MRSEVFFAQLHQHLLMVFVGADVALETEDGVGEIGE